MDSSPPGRSAQHGHGGEAPPRSRARTTRTLEVPLPEELRHNISALEQAITQRGGRAILVGGAVRDSLDAALRGGSTQTASSGIKDIDIEVYGLEPHHLEALLERAGKVDRTGASFEVFKLALPGQQQPIDISLPRREEHTGTGHKGFSTHADPHMTYASASARRDFTINSMGIDLGTGELLDPHGGQQDLISRTLRHVSPAFSEDPLRVLRGARFAARLGLTLDPDTLQLCRELRDRANELPHERVWGELQAIMLNTKTPGTALDVLDQTDWITIFEPLARLRGVQQDPNWHPEGDVYTHTKHVVNYWAEHCRSGNLEDDLVTGFATLCHDLGKAHTTEWHAGRWQAHGHEKAGIEPTRELLLGLGQVTLARKVVPLVENHLAPLALHKAQATDRAIRRLSQRVGRLDLLALVAVADAGGRPPLSPQRGHDARDWLLEAAARLGVTQGPPQALANGDMLKNLGLTPGPDFGELLKTAYQAQIDGHITNAEQAQDYLTALVSSRAQETRQDLPAEPGSEHASKKLRIPRGSSNTIDLTR